MRSREFISEVHWADLYPSGFAAFRAKYNKLKNRPDLYVQFTSHTGTTLEKSPNPSPDHSDPVGVYGYPLKYVIEWPADLWYGSRAKYLRVLQSRSQNILRVNGMSENDCENVLYKMGFRYVRDLLQQAKKDYNHKGTNAWPKAMMAVIQVDMSQPKGERTARNGLEQTALFRKAGFDAVVDDSRNDNTAVINAREPNQIIFLKRNAFTVIDTFSLRANATTVNTSNNPDDDPTFIRKAAAMIAKGLDDRLIDGEGKLFWTRKGRRIAIRVDRPPSYYQNKKIGQKVHKLDRLHTSHQVQADLHGEFGRISLHMYADERLSDLGKAAAERLANSTVDPNWQPETKDSYKRKVAAKEEEALKARMQGEADKRVQEWINSTEPEIAASADEAGLPWRPPPNDPKLLDRLSEATSMTSRHYAQSIYVRAKHLERAAPTYSQSLREIVKQYDFRADPQGYPFMAETFYPNPPPPQFDQIVQLIEHIWHNGPVADLLTRYYNLPFQTYLSRT